MRSRALADREERGATGFLVESRVLAGLLASICGFGPRYAASVPRARSLRHYVHSSVTLEELWMRVSRGVMEIQDSQISVAQQV